MTDKKKPESPQVTVSITAKSLKDIIKREDASISVLRQDLFIFLKEGIKGKVYNPGDIINPLCLSIHKVKNLSQARTKQVACLRELERINNFVTSWIDFDKKGSTTLRLTNKKLDGRKKKDGEDKKDNKKQEKVTFKKASLIDLLDKFIDSDGATRAQKRVALELAELLEGDK